MYSNQEAIKKFCKEILSEPIFKNSEHSEELFKLIYDEINHYYRFMDKAFEKRAFKIQEIKQSEVLKAYISTASKFLKQIKALDVDSAMIENTESYLESLKSIKDSSKDPFGYFGEINPYKIFYTDTRGELKKTLDTLRGILKQGIAKDTTKADQKLMSIIKKIQSHLKEIEKKELFEILKDAQSPLKKKFNIELNSKDISECIDSAGFISYSNIEKLKYHFYAGIEKGIESGRFKPKQKLTFNTLSKLF